MQTLGKLQNYRQWWVQNKPTFTREQVSGKMHITATFSPNTYTMSNREDVGVSNVSLPDSELGLQVYTFSAYESCPFPGIFSSLGHCANYIYVHWSLFLVVSSFKFIQYPKHMYIVYNLYICLINVQQ